MSPTQRTLTQLKHEGFFCRVVEKWNPYARIRQDLWGADIIALRQGSPTILIQCTTQSNAAARIHKVCAIPEVAVWVGNGGIFQVWGWRKIKRGNRHLWEVDKRPITLEVLSQHRRLIESGEIPKVDDDGEDGEDLHPA